MIRNIFLLVLLLAAIGSYTWYDDFHQQKMPVLSETASTAIPRQKAPDFKFTTPDGQNHALYNYEGKAVILNFWASWCAPCVIEFPQMLDLAKKSDAVFLFLSVDDNKADLEKFLWRFRKQIKEQNIVIGWDKDRHISQTLFQTTKFPETYLIDPALEIREKIVGNSVEWNSPAMQKKIDLLAKPL